MSSSLPRATSSSSLSRTVPLPSPAFVDVARAAGLNYRWEFSGKRPGNILQTIGHGCAFLDFDNDGNLDILLVGSKLALYKGDGKGHFVDVSVQTGITAFQGHFLGCAVGDYDNDGYDDIYISAYRGGILLHNEGGRRFKDATKQAGITAQPWGSSCTFADLDGDGLLDLVIGNYVRFGPETQPQLCNEHGFMTSCGPDEYAPEWGVCYRNRGNGRFEDVTKRWGMTSTAPNTGHGKTLGVAAAPVLKGNRPALALANDQEPGDLYTFDTIPPRNQGIASGIAYGADSRVYAGMGVDWGDYDNDAQLDLVVATYWSQPKWVFHNQGGLFTAQNPADLGMRSCLPYIAFGVKWIDFDNDGWLDLLFANGHVRDNAADIEIRNIGSPGARYRQPTFLYHNVQGKRFEDDSLRLQGDAGRPIVGRGLAIGDYDNDGKMDALLVDNEGAPLLLHNVAQNAGNWLLLRLVGQRSNVDGYGAVVTIEAGNRKWKRYCHADGSYLSSSDKRIHVGLGSARTATITVAWPSGMSRTYRNVRTNQILTLREGRR